MAKTAVIIGAGISGLTAATMLKDHGYSLRIFDSRKHIGGNCHDYNVDGSWVHKYGPHIFHTNNELVWEFLNRFTTFLPYAHLVLARTSKHSKLLLPIPFNKVTAELIGGDISDDDIRKLFFIEYSEKMWGCSWEELPRSITGRVPNRRQDSNMRYFTDTYQGMPLNGYSGMFNRMAEHIGVEAFYLGAGQDDWREFGSADIVIYTGSIDAFFKGKLGWLPYRTLRIEHGFLPRKETLPVATVNECNKKPYTRTTDYSVFPSAPFDKASNAFVPITREYPGEWAQGKTRFYPKRFNGGTELYDEYVAMALTHATDVTFLGRLGTFSYLDMHQAVSSALHKTKALILKSK